MTKLVADASSLVEYLLGTSRGAAVAVLLERDGADVHVPSLCDVEVASALRTLIRTRKLDLPRARSAIADYADLPLTRHGHVGVLPRVLELRDNFSAYDATYVALSERLGGDLLTSDDALAAAVRRHLPGLRIAGS